MENKRMSADTWLNCKMGLNDLLARYEDLLITSVQFANDATSQKYKEHFIDNAKYWAKKYKNVIMSINELKNL